MSVLMLLRTCPTYVSSYSYIRVLVLLHARPHTAIYVSSYSYARVLILPCVLILLSSLHRRHLSWHSHTCVVAESRLHCGYCSIQILSGPPYGSWGRWRHNKIQGEKVWEGETVFLTGRVTNHEGMYKKTHFGVGIAGLRSYHQHFIIKWTQIQNSAVPRGRGTALNYRADLTSEAMERSMISL
jgi:hypothetical protein